MKRKMLLVIGKSDLIFQGEYSFKTERLIEELQKRDDIELVIVGDYKAEHFDYESLTKAISELNENQPLTVIMNTHGSIKNGYFEFLMDNNSRLSSKDLFSLISQKMTNTPVNLFTPACHGGGILYDKDILPVSSTLVVLTDMNEVNHGGDFDKISGYLNEFDVDLSAYNLLQLFLSKCLKNRYHPHIGIAGGVDYSLDDLLKSYISTPIDFDSSHFESLGSPKEYREVFDKIVMSKSEWSIYAAEYGMALAIILNDLKNQGKLDISIKSTKTM